jgi:hypothetical protein
MTLEVFGETDHSGLSKNQNHDTSRKHKRCEFEIHL